MPPHIHLDESKKKKKKKQKKKKQEYKLIRSPKGTQELCSSKYPDHFTRALFFLLSRLITFSILNIGTCQFLLVKKKKKKKKKYFFKLYNYMSQDLSC